MSNISNSIAEKLSRNSFYLSILLHILFALFLLIAILSQPKEAAKQLLPHEYVPAYTYTGSIKPSSVQPVQSNPQRMEKSENNENDVSKVNNTPSNKMEVAQEAQAIQSVEHTQSSFRVPQVKKQNPAPTKNLFQKSILAASFNVLKEEQMNEISKKKEADPILLIGDDSQPADPLIKLLGRSLSAHFRYPHMAGQLGITGRVVISLTLHPEGYYSDVQIVQSSDNQELDGAALYAVNSAPTVEGADRFISTPKHFVIGFLFDY